MAFCLKVGIDLWQWFSVTGDMLGGLSEVQTKNKQIKFGSNVRTVRHGCRERTYLPNFGCFVVGLLYLGRGEHAGLARGAFLWRRCVVSH